MATADLMDACSVIFKKLQTLAMLRCRDRIYLGHEMKRRWN
jgi:hypothetical protein